MGKFKACQEEVCAVILTSFAVLLPRRIKISLRKASRREFLETNLLNNLYFSALDQLALSHCSGRQVLGEPEQGAGQSVRQEESGRLLDPDWELEGVFPWERQE